MNFKLLLLHWGLNSRTQDSSLSKAQLSSSYFTGRPTYPTGRPTYPTGRPTYPTERPPETEPVRVPENSPGLLVRSPKQRSSNRQEEVHCVSSWVPHRQQMMEEWKVISLVKKSEELSEGKELDGCSERGTRQQKYVSLTMDAESESVILKPVKALPPATIAAVASAIISGVSLFGTSALQISQSINTSRNVTIEITNKSDSCILENPLTFSSSGYCHHPPQPTITKDIHVVCSFSKTSHAARGAVGVLTYQIKNKTNHVGDLAIMFSVPYDYYWYTNVFAIGIVDPNTKCDEALFNKMYEGSGPFTRGEGTGNCITYTGKRAVVKGTMSAGGVAVMKVELWDE